MEKDLLLVIDMQNVYAHGGAWCCTNAEAAAEKICELIDKESGKIDVICTGFIASEKPAGTWKRYNQEYSDIVKDDYANELMPVFKKMTESQPDRFPYYEKSTYSSLSIPEVKKAAKEARRVLVSGVVAECCVLATAMALIDEGDEIIYLTDAVAGISDETEKATELILSGLEPVQVKRMTVGEYLEEY